jgi:hypothetical protein
MWSVLDPEAAGAKMPNFGRLKSGRATVEVSDGNQSFEFHSDFAGENTRTNASFDIEVAYINTSSESARIQSELSRSENPEDIINGVGATVLSSDQLKEINFLTMRNYREVKLYEVELADEAVPFFEVSFGPDRYDSRSMGSGEFSAFFLWWRLGRARPKSILLIEEPECFLSPGSQSAFIDFLMGVLFSKKICAVVSSHSAEIITPLPSESVRFFRREHAGVMLVTEKPSPILLETIGIRAHRDVLAFVEDEAAARFCRLLAERFDPTLSRRMIIVPKNGEGEIVNLLKQVENKYDSLSILGIFDGDTAGKIPEGIEKKASFLPGDQPIEGLFKALAEEAPNELQIAIGSGDVREALFALQGRDHHDWFLELGKSCGLEPGQMFMVLFGMWIRHGQNEIIARAAFEELQKRIAAVAPVNESNLTENPVFDVLTVQTEITVAGTAGQAR